MTDYTVHPDEMFDPGKPILGATFLQGRDNLAATMEGATGAPRLHPDALGVLTAGDVLRYEQNSTASVGSPANAEVGFIQTGQVRCQIIRNGGGGTITNYRVERWRYGVLTVLYDGAAGVTMDVDVQVGDVINMIGEQTSGASFIGVIFRIRTGGEIIWPGAANLVFG